MAISFSDWLRQEIEKRDLSQADLARRARLSEAQISRLLADKRGVGEGGLRKIADALQISPITVLRKAGILPPSPETEITADDWMFLLSELPPEEQEELRQLALIKIERQKSKKRVGRAVRPDG